MFLRLFTPMLFFGVASGVAHADMDYLGSKCESELEINLNDPQKIEKLISESRDKSVDAAVLAKLFELKAVQPVEAKFLIKHSVQDYMSDTGLPDTSESCEITGLVSYKSSVPNDKLGSMPVNGQSCELYSSLMESAVSLNVAAPKEKCFNE